MHYKTVPSFALPTRGLAGYVCFLSQSAQTKSESLAPSCRLSEPQKQKTRRRELAEEYYHSSSLSSNSPQMQSTAGSPQPEQTSSSIGAPQILHGLHPHFWHILHALKRTLLISVTPTRPGNSKRTCNGAVILRCRLKKTIEFYNIFL